MKTKHTNRKTENRQHQIRVITAQGVQITHLTAHQFGQSRTTFERAKRIGAGGYVTLGKKCVTLDLVNIF